MNKLVKGEMCDEYEIASFVLYTIAEDFIQKSGCNFDLFKDEGSVDYNITANALNSFYDTKYSEYDLMTAYWTFDNELTPAKIAWLEKHRSELISNEKYYDMNSCEQSYYNDKFDLSSLKVENITQSLFNWSDDK